MLQDCSFICHEILMFIIEIKSHFFPNYVILLIKLFLLLAAASVYDLMLQFSSQQWSGQAAPAPPGHTRHFYFSATTPPRPPPPHLWPSFRASSRRAGACSCTGARLPFSLLSSNQDMTSAPSKWPRPVPVLHLYWL